MSFANRAAEDMTVPAQPDRVPYPILRRHGSGSAGAIPRRAPQFRRVVL
jgi:hypothetical protein